MRIRGMTGSMRGGGMSEGATIRVFAWWCGFTYPPVSLGPAMYQG